MTSRYATKPPPDFSGSNAFQSEPQAKRKADPLQDFLRMGAGVMPAVGGVAGGLLGTFAAPGLGTAAGAGLGMAAGSGLGGLMTGGADMMGADAERAEGDRLRRENDRAARMQAALGLL